MLRSYFAGFRPGRLRLLMILCGLLVCVVLAYRLNTLPSGISQQEKNYAVSASSLRAIYKSPDNAPHKLLILAEKKAIKPAGPGLRAVSYIFALVFAASFYLLCVRWFGRTVAVLSLAAFILSPFFISTARELIPDILRFAPLALMGTYYWQVRSEKKDAAWIILLVICAITLYVPGLFWWVIAAAIICRKQLLSTAGRISQPAAAAGLLLFILLIVPIVMAFISDWRFVYRYLLIPSVMPAPFDLIKHLGWMILALFAKTPYHDQLFIGRLPMLSLIQLALAVFGVYALFSAAKNKAIWLSASIIFGILLSAINNDSRMLFFSLPGLGIFMAAGLRYLYIEWRSVFPKNPIPKTLAIILLSAVVTIQAIYGIGYSLVAWPSSQPTKAVYVIK